jgi:hypothetical protein
MYEWAHPYVSPKALLQPAIMFCVDFGQHENHL